MRSYKNDGVITNNLAFSNGFNRDVRLASLFQNFAKCFRGSARRVFFPGVMDLGNLGCELLAEDLRRATREREQCVHTHAEIRSENNRQQLRSLFNQLS